MAELPSYQPADRRFTPPASAVVASVMASMMYTATLAVDVLTRLITPSPLDRLKPPLTSWPTVQPAAALLP
ncbi:hypothetical protein D3C80_2036150 [compost metagenome]